MKPTETASIELSPQASNALAPADRPAYDPSPITILEAAVQAAPNDTISLARLSTAWRLLGEERDEDLMGYDELVRVFDLEPPSGFSGMAAFNACRNSSRPGWK